MLLSHDEWLRGIFYTKNRPLYGKQPIERTYIYKSPKLRSRKMPAVKVKQEVNVVRIKI